MNVTPAEFARHIGHSRQYVHKLIHSRKLAVRGGRIDLEKGLAALRDQHDPAQDLRSDAPEQTATLASLGFYQARAILEQIRAKREKLLLDRLEGRLLDVDHISTAVEKVFSTLRNNLRGIPRRLAAQLHLAKTEAQCEHLMREAIDAELKRTAKNPYGSRKRSL